MTLQLVEKKKKTLKTRKEKKKNLQNSMKKNIERHTHNMKFRYDKLIYRHQIGNKYN